MQKSLFEEKTTTGASRGLVIRMNQKKPLSRQQQTFNKLIKKIEKLRVDLIRVGKSLDEKLDFYLKHIHPVQQQLTSLNKEAVKLLFVVFKNKKMLSKEERQSLKFLIGSRLDDIFQSEAGEPDDELKLIFKAVEGISYEEAVEEEFDDMKNDMESIFGVFGVDINFDGLHSKMTEEEIMQKTMEMKEQFIEQANEKGQKEAERKKTKKQVQEEERARQVEEARTKNIGSIYKQLAKILHPDLEQNEALKLQKEELMKQLTHAYENNDLHTLLNLELTWIQNEENNPGKLTDDKLDIYNEVLKEQILELEDELGEIRNHPRYQPLQSFNMFSGKTESSHVKHAKQEIEARKNLEAANLVKLKGNEKQVLSAVRKMIHDFNTETRAEMDFAQFFR